ncbi:hypothetical protein N7539_008409 [Penicillium diatomitis]|uniref:Uncharacterized protein n=1 Tax=Penicillium diatomitis TaxID=2819901 RepID=A0A9W9WU69_9EURO|nr:uncharacterized protein N7539_008409 [Penicillium diatomitis]KAJ5475343.1 hypothetical protein N7539_008409 [Penicillium diatomitis]
MSVALEDRKEIFNTDHRRFIPGLPKVIILPTLQLYLFTGARIGAFVPAHEDKKERGLRFKHIELVLFPSSTAPWKLEWKVNQVWLKNNRDPNYTVLGIGIRDTKKPQFAAGYILLALALEHGALFGVSNVEDLAQYDLSNGPIPLRWKDEYLEKPVLRNVTADGPQDVPLAKDVFCECLRVIFTAAGYSKRPKVHDIRKFLGKKIEGKHGSALVSQIYGHKGAGTYPKDYLLHCSSIDTVSAVLDEEDQSEHIEYFQGFERFYEPGLPGELPAGIEQSILDKPELLEIRSRIQRLEDHNADKESINAERLNYKKTIVHHRLFELKEYQAHWVRERRDRRILNRGKQEPLTLENDVRTRAQALSMPELSRIAALMSCNRELSFDEMLLFVQDLQSQCALDFDVVYLPGESPTQGLCPARGCRKQIARITKSERNTHVHDCVRHEKALDLHLSESKLRFCYQCMEWLTSSQWRDHCNVHLEAWDTKHCEVITYRRTVIRPGHCPFSLWDLNLPAEERLYYWLKSGNLKKHIEEQHICEQKEPPKKLRFYRYPPPRYEHEHRLSANIFLPVPTLLTFMEEHPEQYDSSNVSDESTESSSFVSCFSDAETPLSSRSRTPQLEDFIDPRILEPFQVDKEGVYPPCGQSSVQLGSIRTPLEEHETKSNSSCDSLCPRTCIPNLATQSDFGVETNGRWSVETSGTPTEISRQACDEVPSQLHSLSYSVIQSEAGLKSLSDMKQSQCSPPSFTPSEANEQKKALREDCPISTSDNKGSPVAVHERGNRPPAHQGVSDKVNHHAGESAIGRCGTLTRTRAKR